MPRSRSAFAFELASGACAPRTRPSKLRSRPTPCLPGGAMTELSAKARRVLELSRETDEPALEVQRRVERALSARIATGTESSALIAKSSAANFAPAAAKTLVPLGVAAAMV